MSHYVTTFKSPPVMHKDDGSQRRVGFELEFSGLTLEQTAAALHTALGGTIESKSAAEQVLQVDALGRFNVELDWDFLKRKAAETAEGEASGEWVETLGQAAAVFVPIEVVCPPIAISELDVLRPMVTALRDAGAVGTEESLVAAYGLHINSEIPCLDAATLFSYLRAFAVLQWWLVEAHEVDPTRRITPYIDLYPEAYLRQVLSTSATTLDAIFVDYLEHNATRNRALDLLPLLAAIDETRVRRIVDDPKIKARPAFHYRLPNCHIERSDWSLAAAWNTWWYVEQLAARPDDLDELGAAFLEASRPLLGVSRKPWVEFIDQWLHDHALG